MNIGIRAVVRRLCSSVVIAACHALLACGGGGGANGGAGGDLQNPLPQTQATVDAGNAIYHGRGTCFACHGDTGKGDGPAGVALNPPPADLTNSQLHASRTDADLFRAVKNGIPNTGMISYNPAMIDDTETWEVVTYIRSLNGT